jgi:hypothetical protein
MNSKLSRRSRASEQDRTAPASIDPGVPGRYQKPIETPANRLHPGGTVYQKESCKSVLSQGFSPPSENRGVLGSIPSLAISASRPLAAVTLGALLGLDADVRHLLGVDVAPWLITHLTSLLFPVRKGGASRTAASTGSSKRQKQDYRRCHGARLTSPALTLVVSVSSTIGGSDR